MQSCPPRGRKKEIEISVYSRFKYNFAFAAYLILLLSFIIVQAFTLILLIAQNTLRDNIEYKISESKETLYVISYLHSATNR